MLLQGGGHKLLRRHVHPQVDHFQAAALHHDLHQVLADIVHIALDGAQADPAQHLAAAAGEPGLQQLQGGSHAAGGHQHLRHKGPAGGEIVPQAGHAVHQTVRQQKLSFHTLVKPFLAQLEHLLPLPLAQGQGQGGEQVGTCRLLGFCCFGLLCGQLPPGDRVTGHSGHMQGAVIAVDLVVDQRVNMGIDRAEQTVGDRGNIVATGAIGCQGLAHIAAHLALGGVGPVNGGADAAHEHHAALQLPLEGGNVVLRQDALPDLDAQLHHVLHNGNQVGIRVVQGNDPAGTDVPVEPTVRLLEELPPHLRLHEQSVLGAPVVMGEDQVRVEVVNEHFHIADAVIGDVIDQLMHLLRVLIEVGEGILKAHEKMALLKDAGAHETGDQPVLTRFLPGQRPAFLPALGAVGFKVRGMDKVPPAGDVRADLIFLGNVGHGAGSLRRPHDGGAPTVLTGAAPLPVAPEVAVDGVPQRHGQRFVLFQLPFRLAVWLEKFKEYLFWALHGVMAPFQIIRMR